MPPALLITAGPTHEPIDAVRYIGNRSSGRMGLALAAAAERRGWPATLLLGPTNLAPPTDSRIALHRFRTASDLQGLLALHWPQSDVLVMAAAVADFRPVASRVDIKLRRDSGRVALELEPTPDLLAEAARTKRPDQIVIGFALEPADQLLDAGRAKLERKGIDAIVANPLETMDAEDISATLILADGRVVQPQPRQSKAKFADWLLDQIGRLDTRV